MAGISSCIPLLGIFNLGVNPVPVLAPNIEASEKHMWVYKYKHIYLYRIIYNSDNYNIIP